MCPISPTRRGGALFLYPHHTKPRDWKTTNQAHTLGLEHADWSKRKISRIRRTRISIRSKTPINIDGCLNALVPRSLN